MHYKTFLLSKILPQKNVSSSIQGSKRIQWGKPSLNFRKQKKEEKYNIKYCITLH